MYTLLKALIVLALSLTVSSISLGEVKYPVTPGVGVGPVRLGRPVPVNPPFSLQDPYVVKGVLAGFSVNTGGTVALNGVMVGHSVQSAARAAYDACDKEHPTMEDAEVYTPTTRATWAWFTKCGLGARIVSTDTGAMLQAWAVFKKGDNAYHDFIRRNIAGAAKIPPTPSLEGRTKELLFSTSCGEHTVAVYAYKTPEEVASGDYTVRVDEIDGRAFATILMEPGADGKAIGVWFDTNQDGKPDEFFPDAATTMAAHPDWCEFYTSTRPF